MTSATNLRSSLRCPLCEVAPNGVSIQLSELTSSVITVDCHGETLSLRYLLREGVAHMGPLINALQVSMNSKWTYPKRMTTGEDMKRKREWWQAVKAKRKSNGW